MKKLILLSILMLSSPAFAEIPTQQNRFVIHGQYPSMVLLDGKTGKTWAWSDGHWQPMIFSCDEYSGDTSPDCLDPGLISKSHGSETSSKAVKPSQPPKD